VQTLGRIYERSLARTSLTLTLLAIAGSMALLLGVIGIYAVIAYAVSQSTREIGIRIALGAKRGAVRRLFVRDALVLAAIGIAIGLVAAAGSSLLFGVSAVDPVTYAIVTITLIVAVASASYLPARRASRVAPMEALRAD
jgi:putative ABC transport system permease protein